ncbi:MAG: hypothetical protein IT175_06100 [Acidobacteria bacterium]|nr:hypothetical protein [Acidobacteriota bacterium]
MTTAGARARWLAYIKARPHSYEFYCAQRYDPVIDCLVRLGLRAGELVYDVGAGMCDLGRRMVERGHYPRYVPVDGSIDGTDLETWAPAVTADFFVAVETLEHLRDPWRLVGEFERWATVGAVITTPNPEVVDVRSLDGTHVSELRPNELVGRGWTAHRISMFGTEGDSVLATWSAEPGQ